MTKQVNCHGAKFKATYKGGGTDRSELYLISKPKYLKSLGLRGLLSIYTLLSFFQIGKLRSGNRALPKNFSDL